MCRVKTNNIWWLFAQLPDASSLERTEAVVKQMSDIALAQPGVAHSVAFPGLSINGFY